MSKFAEAVRTLRSRLGLTTTEFGRLLGVSHASVSCYESGKTTPGLLPLMRMLKHARGTEKNPILEKVEGLLSGPVSDEAALKDVEFDAWVPISIEFPPATVGERLKVLRATRPQLAQWFDLSATLISRSREVDESLVQILRLWLDHDDTDPEVRRCFSDAVGYLKVMLTAKVHGNRRQSVRRPKSA